MTDGMKLVAPSGQDLVRIRLMSRVPYELVIGRIERIVERDSEFNGAETGSKMSTGFRNAVDKEVSHFGGNFAKIGDSELAKVGGRYEKGSDTAGLSCVIHVVQRELSSGILGEFADALFCGP